MKICIILYSKTGNTLALGKLFEAKLKDKGHSVDLVELKTDPEIASGTAKHHPEFTITNLPDTSEYDALLVGGPVWAFSASPVIYEATKKLGDLSEKKVLPFFTMGFPLTFMGGKQAIGLITKELSKKGANVLPGKAVTSRNIKKRMEEVSSEVALMFG